MMLAKSADHFQNHDGIRIMDSDRFSYFVDYPVDFGNIRTGNNGGDIVLSGYFEDGLDSFDMLEPCRHIRGGRIWTDRDKRYRVCLSPHIGFDGEFRYHGIFHEV